MGMLTNFLNNISLMATAIGEDIKELRIAIINIVNDKADKTQIRTDQQIKDVISSEEYFSGTSSQFVKANGTLDSNTYLKSNQNDSSTGSITATNFILSSDVRLKTNIIDLEPNKLDVQWKSFQMKSDKGDYRTGVIAQELEQKHPEFVKTDDKGFKSVKYIDLLIAKISELETRIKELEK